jgi:hypothetical protein
VRRQGLLFEGIDGRTRFLVEPGQVVLAGRQPPVSPLNVRIPSEFASRHHFRVLGDPGGTWRIEDAGSACGIYRGDGRRNYGAIGPGEQVGTGKYDWMTHAFAGDSVHTLMHAGQVPIGEALTMAHAVLQQLLPLHAAGDVHGNLNPHDVLREDNGRYVVLIRGFRPLEHDALPENRRYRAPELLEHRLQPASDVFAVGLLVYELLTGGRHPLSELSSAPFSKDWPDGLRNWLSRLVWYEPSGRLTVAQALACLDALHAELITLGILDEGPPVVGWLVPLDGPPRGQTFRLSPPVSIIGRGSGADVPVEGTAVHEGHCRIVFHRRGFLLVVGDSDVIAYRNRRVTGTLAFVDGDVIDVGGTRLVFKTTV